MHLLFIILTSAEFLTEIFWPLCTLASRRPSQLRCRPNESATANFHASVTNVSRPVVVPINSENLETWLRLKCLYIVLLQELLLLELLLNCF